MSAKASSPARKKEKDSFREGARNFFSLRPNSSSRSRSVVRMLRPKTPSMSVGTGFCSKLTLHQQISAGESAAKIHTAGACLGFEGGGDLLQALRTARSALPCRPLDREHATKHMHSEPTMG